MREADVQSTPALGYRLALYDQEKQPACFVNQKRRSNTVAKAA